MRELKYLPECTETLVINDLTFTCQLAAAHDGMHRSCADDDQGVQVEWPIAWPAGVRQETNTEKDSGCHFSVESESWWCSLLLGTRLKRRMFNR
jgi:hypothetical protein